MPFGLLIIFLVVLWFVLRKHKLLSYVILMVVVITYLINTGIGTYIFVKPLEIKYHGINIFAETDIDAIVILGGGIIIGPDSNYLNPHALQRIYKSVLLLKKMDVPIIVTGGKSLGRNGPPEAQIMAKVLENMGVDFEKIIVEPRAKNTYENSFYTNEICKKRNWKNLILVTSAVHMERAMRCFKIFDVKVVPCPTDYRYDYSSLSWIDFIPTQEALDANLAAIHEFLGLLWYKIKYF